MNSKRIATISTIALLLNFSGRQTASAVTLHAHEYLIQPPVEAASKSNAAATAAVSTAAAATTEQQRKDNTEKEQEKAQIEKKQKETQSKVDKKMEELDNLVKDQRKMQKEEHRVEQEAKEEKQKKRKHRKEKKDEEEKAINNRAQEILKSHMKMFADSEQAPLDKPEMIEAKKDTEKEQKQEEQKKEEIKQQEPKKEVIKQEAPPVAEQEPAYMKKFRLEQTEGTKEWIVRQQELYEAHRKEEEQKQKKQEQELMRLQQAQAVQQKAAESDDNEYQTDSIVDYSKSLFVEKKMSSAKQSNNDFDIVTDGLNDEDVTDQIEAKKENQKIADERVKSAEEVAERVKQEDEAQKKAEIEQKRHAANENWSIATDKLVDEEAAEDKVLQSKKVEAQGKGQGSGQTAKAEAKPAAPTADNTKSAVKPPRVPMGVKLVKL